jgi:hypothetical protein
MERAFEVCEDLLQYAKNKEIPLKHLLKCSQKLEDDLLNPLSETCFRDKLRRGFPTNSDLSTFLQSILNSLHTKQKCLIASMPNIKSCPDYTKEIASGSVQSLISSDDFTLIDSHSSNFSLFQLANPLVLAGIQISSDILHAGSLYMLGNYILEVFRVSPAELSLQLFDSHRSSLVLCKTLFGKESFSIGRDLNCDLQIADRSISRTHALVNFTGKGWEIADNTSNNGLFKCLHSSDSLSSGSSFKLQLQFECEHRLKLGDEYFALKASRFP